MTSDEVEPAVVLVVFNRPSVTRQLIEKLSAVRPRRLYVIADGPRENRGEEEVRAVREVRELFEDTDWVCELVRVFAEGNLGLRERVLSGLDYVFEHESQAIILEDDCHPSLDFFEFIGETRTRVSPEQGVGVISGTNLAPARIGGSAKPQVTQEINIWGWFTWQSVWRDFRSSTQASPMEASAIIRSIGVPHYRRALRAQLDVVEQLDSWAFWFALHLAKSGLGSLQPPVNLVENVGFGPSSTHTKFESWAHQPRIGNLSSKFTPLPSVQSKWEARAQSSRFYLRWLIFPSTHPFVAIRRVLRYLNSRV